MEADTCKRSPSTPHAPKLQQVFGRFRLALSWLSAAQGSADTWEIKRDGRRRPARFIGTRQGTVDRCCRVSRLATPQDPSGLHTWGPPLPAEIRPTLKRWLLQLPPALKVMYAPQTTPNGWLGFCSKGPLSAVIGNCLAGQKSI